MERRQVSMRQWFFSVFGWDGILPACVLLAPWLIEYAIPNERDAGDIAGVMIPIVAFLVRFVAGIRHISTNACSPGFQSLQFWVFCAGILVMVLIDTLLILSHQMGVGAAFATTTDYIVFAALYAGYLVCMTIAMYPGRSFPMENVES